MSAWRKARQALSFIILVFIYWNGRNIHGPCVIVDESNTAVIVHRHYYGVNMYKNSLYLAMHNMVDIRIRN